MTGKTTARMGSVCVYGKSSTAGPLPGRGLAKRGTLHLGRVDGGGSLPSSCLLARRVFPRMRAGSPHLLAPFDMLVASRASPATFMASPTRSASTGCGARSAIFRRGTRSRRKVIERIPSGEGVTMATTTITMGIHIAGRMQVTADGTDTAPTVHRQADVRRRVQPLVAGRSGHPASARGGVASELEA